MDVVWVITFLVWTAAVAWLAFKLGQICGYITSTIDAAKRTSETELDPRDENSGSPGSDPVRRIP